MIKLQREREWEREVVVKTQHKRLSQLSERFILNRNQRPPPKIR